MRYRLPVGAEFQFSTSQEKFQSRCVTSSGLAVCYVVCKFVSGIAVGTRSFLLAHAGFLCG